MRIFNTVAHHLVATADADDGFPVFMRLHNRFRHTIVLDVDQIGNGVLASGKDDNVCFLNICRRIELSSAFIIIVMS